MIHISSANPAHVHLGSTTGDDAKEETGVQAQGASHGADDPFESLAAGSAMARLGGLLGLHRAVQAYAWRAPGGGAGSSQGAGPGAAQPATVSKTDVLKAMKGGFVDINNLSDPLKKALADAGTDATALARLADKQGRVWPDKLFAFIDRFDSNGNPGSFSTETFDAFGTKVQSRAGALYDALSKEVDANRAVADGGKSAKAFEGLAAGHGVLDVHHLGAAVKKALAGAAVTQADLAAVAGVDGQIKGKKEFAALHALLDKADGRVDGIASAKVRLADGTVGDSGSAAALQAIQDEVASNRKLPQYARPGAAVGSTLARLTVDKDAMKVDPEDQKPVDLKMKGVDQFSLYPGDDEKGGKACYQAAVKACSDHNAKHHGKAAPQLNGPHGAIQIAYAEDANGRVAVNQTQARIGREYIDAALDAGYPAVIGVSYADHAYNNDRMTDHFVTVDKRGYDDQNRLYYEFKDPGAGGRIGRLHVDADTGKLFKQGDHKGPYVHNADYEVTQVRTYSRPMS